MKNVIKFEIPGMYVLEPNIHEDIRGRIVKTYHRPFFETIEGLSDHNWGEVLLSENMKKGVFRGMHFQIPPYAQAKTICCVTGAIKDWVIDIRKGSPTYGKIEIVTLSAKKREVLYLPEGVANGYYTLEDNTIILYNLTSEYNFEASKGIDGRSIGIDLSDAIIAEKDKHLEHWKNFQSPFIYNRC